MQCNINILVFAQCLYIPPRYGGREGGREGGRASNGRGNANRWI